MKDILNSMLKVLEEQFKNADIQPLQNSQLGFRVSEKTHDDPMRLSKRYQPIIIHLHKDFGTSEFCKRPLSVIHKEFSAFIVNKRSQFNPRETDDLNKSHVPDYWVFPDQC